MQAGDLRVAQVWLLLKTLLTDVIPEPFTSLVHKDLQGSGIPRSLSAPVSATSLVSYGSVTTPMKPTMQSMFPDPILSSHHAHALFSSPLHSPPHSHTPSSNRHKQQRSISNNSPYLSSSNPPVNGGRMPANKHLPPSDLLHTKAPPNSRNQTPVSSAASSPRHHTTALPSGPPHTHPPATPTTPMPLVTLPVPKTAPSPTLAMTPQRTTLLGSRPHTATHGHSHTRRPSVFTQPSAVPTMHNESATSTSRPRRIDQGALSDDSDVSEAGGEGEGDPPVPASAGTSTGVNSARNRSPNTGEHVPASPAGGSPPRPRPPIVATRSLSLSRANVGPVHPSPLSRVAGQQAWPDTESTRDPTDSEDDGSPSPGSTDSESAPCGSGDECRAKHHGAARVRTGSMVKIRPRKVSRSLHRKTRSRSATVASLAAPLLPPSPAVSSPVGGSVGTPVSPQAEPSLNHRKEKGLVRRASQSSVQTVIANSLREAENDGDTSMMDVPAHDTSLVLESWIGMSDQQKLAVMEEEIQLREAAWQALKNLLEVFADKVSILYRLLLFHSDCEFIVQGDIQMCAMLVLFAAGELKIDLVRTIRFIESYVGTLRSSCTPALV